MRLLTLLLTFSLLTTSAEACSCAWSTLSEHLEQSDVVFAGEAVSLQEKDGITSATFKMNQMFKGSAQNEIVVTTPSQYTCGVTFEKGKKYLIFGFANPSGEFETTDCSGTRLLDNVTDKDLAELTS